LFSRSLHPQYMTDNDNCQLDIVFLVTHMSAIVSHQMRTFLSCNFEPEIPFKWHIKAINVARSSAIATIRQPLDT
jgi:hypothetical protein